jgi:hypothetical protein
VLGKTLGVPLFQEQAMRVAIECAGFTPGEADQLRRAMATFKHTGGVSAFRRQADRRHGRARLRARIRREDLQPAGGFRLSYGFPESHAASFALIAYASSWVKCHHPDVFCAALLNAQPMGFYAPAQIVRDAREHGVEVRPVCINARAGTARWSRPRRTDGSRCGWVCGMVATKILWGQVLLVSAVVLAFVWAATEWTAWRSASSPSSATPGSSCSAGRSISRRPSSGGGSPTTPMRAIFVEGAYIAASGGIAAVVAIAMSVWRAREAKKVTTYGSARWAETREVREAGLLGHDGVLLGRWRGDYLRHDGPEHVLCFAPTRIAARASASSCRRC